MILEVDTMLSDWFKDATNGANALLPSTLRTNGHPQPANFALITDETQDGDVARGDLPGTLPCIAVSLDRVDNLDGQVEVITADGKAHVRIRVGLENPISADAVRDLSYYLRTVTRSFRRFMATDSGDPARLRNGIYLETCDELKEAIVWAKDQNGTATVTGYVLATIQLRDNAP